MNLLEYWMEKTAQGEEVLDLPSRYVRKQKKVSLVPLNSRGGSTSLSVTSNLITDKKTRQELASFLKNFDKNKNMSPGQRRIHKRIMLSNVARNEVLKKMKKENKNLFIDPRREWRDAVDGISYSDFRDAHNYYRGRKKNPITAMLPRGDMKTKKKKNLARILAPGMIDLKEEDTFFPKRKSTKIEIEVPKLNQKNRVTPANINLNSKTTGPDTLGRSGLVDTPRITSSRPAPEVSSNSVKTPSVRGKVELKHPSLRSWGGSAKDLLKDKYTGKAALATILGTSLLAGRKALKSRAAKRSAAAAAAQAAAKRRSRGRVGAGLAAGAGLAGLIGLARRRRQERD